jgi:hypothetical protein
LSSFDEGFDLGERRDYDGAFCPLPLSSPFWLFTQNPKRERQGPKASDHPKNHPKN